MKFKEDKQGLPYIEVLKTQSGIHIDGAPILRGIHQEAHPRRNNVFQSVGSCGNSSDRYFKCLLSSQNLDDFPLTIHDANNAHAIFGPNIAGVRGKTFSHKPDRVITDYVSVPGDFLELHKYVTLVADFFCQQCCVFGYHIQRYQICNR